MGGGGGVLQHRRDIDGLRAVAVLPVVLFHAGVAGFAGGFVGVDIFFVISGFLITGILLRDGTGSARSLMRFYDRRIRRIFPALFAMLALVSLAAMAILLPTELRQYSRAFAATVLFVSNVLYWRTSGYFAPLAGDNPLLHTWSLAVEEQFYLLFPPLLWAVLRLGGRRRLPWLLIAAGVGSLALAEVLTRSSPEAAFYLFPTRAWELLLGAALAAWPGGLPGGRIGREVAGWAGLGMIVAAVTLFGPETRVPGAAALLPCIGALLIIWSGRDAQPGASRLLSNPALVGVGLISYSLYLWHWPLLVLSRLYLLRPLTPIEIALAIAVSALLATLSWRFIERPFREGGARPWRFSRERRSIGAGLLVMALALIAAAPMWRGAPWRVPPEVARLDQFNYEPAGRACIDLAAQGRSPACLLDPKPATGPKVVLWGDSHAAQYGQALGALVAARGGELRLAAGPGCAPLPGVAVARPDGLANGKCAQRNETVLRTILADPQVKAVVLAGRWGRFFFPEGDAEARRLRGGDAAAVLAASLDRTLTALEGRGIKVVVIGQAPEFVQPLPSCLARTIWRGASQDVCRFRPETLPGRPYERAIAAAVARHPGAAYVEPAEVVCPAGVCTRWAGHTPVSWDTDHLGLPATEAVVARIPPQALFPAVATKQAVTGF
jgi:peptidoglycan/LPS O-acetylase OafA/YrhL